MDTIDSSVKIFEGAKIIGKVKINAKSSVWYNAVIRGDIEHISIGKCSNIQDNCVIHSSKNYPVNLGDYISVGHAAVLHGCEIGDNCLIGMNSTILNGAKIGKNSIIGAGAVVTEGKEFDEGSLILGIPAKSVKKLTKEQIKNIKDNAIRYVKLAQKNE
ncbi:gamma carbonic anhydrase family protein [Methanobacterium oryzae]|uniref:gamma carbonic anhydrase family protein n=1 Tax=Methanobacterium oryzae TaxID=69540 RepID=UPI003D252C04